jgi:hypothetical protein
MPRHPVRGKLSGKASAGKKRLAKPGHGRRIQPYHSMPEAAVKRSHQLLIAVAALLAALVLFFWPRSAAAGAGEAPPSFEQRCESAMRPNINVSATAPSYVLINNLSTRVLNTRGSYASASHFIMGMTAGRTRADIDIDGPALIDTASGRECIAPRIDVMLRFEPLDVYVAREFPPQSCAYREVFKHEMQHVRIYAEQLKRIETLVKNELMDRYAGRPLYAPTGKGLETLQAQVNSWLGPLLRDELAKVEVMQRRLDSNEETDKLSHACLGEVAAMMGSSF